MTWKYDIMYELVEMLGLNDVVFQPMRTRYYQFGQYYDGILIAYNTDEFSNEITDVFLDMSGKGCRTVEQLNEREFDWFKFIHTFDAELRDRRAHISRIDIACDVTDGSIGYERIYKYAMHDMFVCRSKVLPDVRQRRTEEVYFGAPSSDRFLRIYNKALEQGLPDTEWIRFEFQMRNDNAISWYLNWCENEDIGKLYAGVMLDYLRFVDIPANWKLDIKEIKRQNLRSKLPTAKWWKDFLGECERTPQMYLPGEEFTLLKLENYLEKQTYSSLKAYIIAHGGDMTKLIDGVKHCKLNTKQKLLLAQMPVIKKQEYELTKEEKI